MKSTYPIVLIPDDPEFVVYIPDFDINTKGNDLTEAIEMARDAIGLMGITLEDDNQPLPLPSPLEKVKTEPKEFVTTFVDVDFSDYRRKNELRCIKKNCTLPGWLCYEAEKASINYSAVLQAALKRELHIN